MERPAPFTPDLEEQAPGLYRRMGVYGPFVWMTVMVLRLGVRIGVISPDYLRPPHGPVTPDLFHMNRQLRRARTSCLRRARRSLMKHGKVNPEDYVPRAYAHFAYVAMMDKSRSIGQFFEGYIRDNGLSRAAVFGLDSAHRITGFTQSARVSAVFSELLSRLGARMTALMGLAPLSLAAPADPAPP